MIGAMPFIETIEPADATEPLAALYQRVGNPDGTLDEVMKVHGLNPDTLRTHFEMYVAAMHKPSPLSRMEREMVAVVVSRLNGCAYCLRHHAAGLARLLPADRADVADALAAGRHANVSEREAALISYATVLTTEPKAVDEADIDLLHAVGLDDRAILDLAQVTAYFAYVNRIVLGLGVELETGSFTIGQTPEPGP